MTVCHTPLLVTNIRIRHYGKMLEIENKSRDKKTHRGPN